MSKNVPLWKAKRKRMNKSIPFVMTLEGRDYAGKHLGVIYKQNDRHQSCSCAGIWSCMWTSRAQSKFLGRKHFLGYKNGPGIQVEPQREASLGRPGQAHRMLWSHVHFPNVRLGDTRWHPHIEVPRAHSLFCPPLETHGKFWTWGSIFSLCTKLCKLCSGFFVEHTWSVTTAHVELKWYLPCLPGCHSCGLPQEGCDLR